MAIAEDDACQAVYMCGLRKILWIFCQQFYNRPVHRLAVFLPKVHVCGHP